MRKRDVINMALDYLGMDPIDSSSNKRTAIEKKASRFYDVASLYILNYYDWVDAITTTTFTTEAAVANVWDDYFSYIYALPSDSLRILDLDLDDEAQYIVEGGYLYTNYYDAANGIVCRYIKDIREESGTLAQYSDLLGECIASRLAYNMAPVDQKPSMKAFADDILHEAMMVNRKSDGWSKRHEQPYITDVDRWRHHGRRRGNWDSHI